MDGSLWLASTVAVCLLMNGNPVAQEAGGEPVPVVMWHGVRDNCCSNTLGRVKTSLEEHLPGIYVKSIKIGSSIEEDERSSYLGNANSQVEKMCEELKADDKLKGGFNAIGFSQGTQLLRAVIQRCSQLRVKNFISLGGQHQGVYGIPYCDASTNKKCDVLREAFSKIAYTTLIQLVLVQAAYWHNPLMEVEYKQKSVFLADINNERYVNETYTANLKKLENFVLVKFNKDTVVQPVETEWFGFYAPGQAMLIENMENTTLFKENRLGLAELQQSNKLHFLSVDADHLEFSLEWFVDSILNKFLK